jgi:hypothetical protein
MTAAASAGTHNDGSRVIHRGFLVEPLRWRLSVSRAKSAFKTVRVRSRCLVLLALLFAGTQFSSASDRLTVIVPPVSQEAAEALAGSLASACNRGDFVAFMGHFTPTHSRRIRGRMEDVFVVHQPKMDIRQVTLLSEADDRITFAVRYAWHDKEGPEEVFASKVVARKVDGEWKLDGESVKAVDRTAGRSQYAEPAGANVVPAVWDPFNPPADRINPALEHLRGDIGIQPGLGCANGRCGR